MLKNKKKITFLKLILVGKYKVDKNKWIQVKMMLRKLGKFTKLNYRNMATI